MLGLDAESPNEWDPCSSRAPNAFCFDALCETWISPPSALSRKTVLPSERFSRLTDELHVVLGFSFCMFLKNEQINYLDVAICDIVFCVAGECQILYRGRRSHNEVVDLPMAVYGIGDRNLVSPLFTACSPACLLCRYVMLLPFSLCLRALRCAMLRYACVRWQVRIASYAWLLRALCCALPFCVLFYLH